MWNSDPIDGSAMLTLLRHRTGADTTLRRSRTKDSGQLSNRCRKQVARQHFQVFSVFEAIPWTIETALPIAAVEDRQRPAQSVLRNRYNTSQLGPGNCGLALSRRIARPKAGQFRTKTRNGILVCLDTLEKSLVIREAIHFQSVTTND